jgi:hypothetical protein
MKLSDYDPDDPPRVTHRQEAERLLGKGVLRILLYFLLLMLLGLDPRDSILAEPWWLQLIALGLFVTIAWTLARGAEHAIADLRQFRQQRSE